MISSVLFVPALIAVLAVLALSLRMSWRGSIHFLPSIGWAFLMALPFFIEYPFFNEATRDTQMWGIVYIAVILCVADVASARFTQKDTPAPDAPNSTRLPLTIAAVLGGAFIVLSLWHLSSADRIPLFEMISGAGDEVTRSQTRNNFSRDAHMPALVRYMCSFAPLIFAMPAVLIFMSRGKHLIALGLMLFVIGYTIAGTAKAPLSMALLIMGAGAVWLAGRHGPKLMRALMVIALSGLAVLSVLDVFSPYESMFKNLPAKYAAAEAVKDHTLTANLGDDQRRRSYDPNNVTPFVWRKIDYILYRVFFTPVEVSERWYEYFHQYPVEGRMLSRMVNDSRFHAPIHPANAVGRWAFFERYPNNYTIDAYAYASIEADAHGRFGLIGIIIAGLILGGMRFGMALFNDLSAPTRGALYITGTALLAYLPSSSSIQAMLIAHGLGILCIMLFTMFVYQHMKRKDA